MRFEATLPKKRGEALVELAKELGITKSQLLDEALGLFLRAVIGAKQGQRLALVRSETTRLEGSCELVTPSLALLDWTAHREVIELSADEYKKVLSLLESPPEPTEALKKLRRKHKK